MDAIEIGPLALPLTALAPLLALAVASLAAWCWQRMRGVDPARTLWHMALWGLLAARAAFVLKHASAYAAEPLQVFNLRDGGFVAFAGLLVALAVGAGQARGREALRLPLATSALAGLLAWAGATLAIHAVQDTRQPLPQLTLRRLEGGEAALATLARGPAVINLWATWCPPCRREMPALAQAQAAHPDVAFLFVNQGEDADTVQRYLAGAAAGARPRNVLLDPRGQLARALGATGYPTTLFFDAEGRLAGRHLGELSTPQLRVRLEALRARR